MKINTSFSISETDNEATLSPQDLEFWWRMSQDFHSKLHEFSTQKLMITSVKVVVDNVTTMSLLDS